MQMPRAAVATASRLLQAGDGAALEAVRDVDKEWVAALVPGDPLPKGALLGRLVHTFCIVPTPGEERTKTNAVKRTGPEA